jgi:glycosyltransferase involved in cell wall biosynthesis
MKKNKIKNIFILINALFLFYYNYLSQLFFLQTNLINYKPKISVIMPIYNGGIYLHYSLKSIQNQKMKDIEIIIVNDNSKDNSSKIVRKLMKKDKRIKLIENKENRRILFSKSIGALNCNGKYILEIDQDDRFINDSAFDILYNISEKYELDILHFKCAHGKDVLNLSKIENYINNKNRHHITIKKSKPIIALLWGNLIKTDLYKRVVIQNII